MPTALDASTLAATAASLVQRPFRTRPVFNSTIWGGHWAQQQLGIGRDQPNTAVGYELIAPESGVLIGVEGGPTVEIPLQLLVCLHPTEVLGEVVHASFGTSFPIRFDYLDTVGGASLSVHCHPLADHMRDVFGWAYAQHETYYPVHTSPGSRIFLGLAAGNDVEDFHTDVIDAAERGRDFDISRHVQSFPATAHQLYLVPAGTPHGSSEGNVVLEVSATPYLYSLRFYDWMRTDSNGSQRSVRPDLAFDNLNHARSGSTVAADLVPTPRQLRSGPGWIEEVLGELPELFFDVRRLEIADGAQAPDDTRGRFHVLNVVEGSGVEISTSSGAHLQLAFAETALIPAAVGAYAVAAAGSRPARVVKALVR